MTNYGPFQNGDGRCKIGFANGNLPGTYPTAVTYSTARMLIDAFVRTGVSIHSGQGATLWVMLEWLHDQKIPYQLKAVPEEGYYIERMARPC